MCAVLLDNREKLLMTLQANLQASLEGDPKVDIA